jgi:hypothetical protein
MEKRKKKEHDFAVTAFRVVQEATGQIKGGFDAKAMGRRGGLKGGPARAAKLTPERREEIARKAAMARWALPHLYDEDKAIQEAGLLMELNGGEMDYAKCMKLMYNIEREALNRWMRPVTFDDLFSLPYGQILSNTLNKAKPENQKVKSLWRQYLETIPATGNDHTIRLTKECGKEKLSRAEVELITEFYQRYKGKTAGQMMDEHHTPSMFPEYKDPGDSSIKTTYSDLLQKLGKSQKQITQFEEDLTGLVYMKKMTE